MSSYCRPSLQSKGPGNDQEEESEPTMTEPKQLRQKHKKELEKRMLGEDSDEDDDYQEEKRRERRSTTSKTADTGCSWGMVEDAEEEEECEENPFAVDYQQEREALYIKDPKKALQGFFEREGEELEYEYEDQGHSTWLCRVRLPVDDTSGRQLVAEATHSGKKKEALIECALEACRILDAKGLLRQEAVSRKRKAKNWEEEDFYDSDDDAFLDRTGSVEKKRLNRMKKAGKIDEKPETYESLLTKLSAVEKELTEIEDKLLSAKKGSSQSSEDPLDAFMTEIRSGGVLDSVARKKLHLQSFELKKEEQRLKKLIKIVRPTSLPILKSQNGSSPAAETKPKKYVLPMFGAMKGGSKFKLKTGTVGKPPHKRPDLPEKLFQFKDEGPEVEEDEEDESAAASSKDKRSIPEPAQANAEVFQQDIDMPHSLGGANCYNNNKSKLKQKECAFDVATWYILVLRKSYYLMKALNLCFLCVVTFMCCPPDSNFDIGIDIFIAIGIDTDVTGIFGGVSGLGSHSVMGELGWRADDLVNQHKLAFSKLNKEMKSLGNSVWNLRFFKAYQQKQISPCRLRVKIQPLVPQISQLLLDDWLAMQQHASVGFVNALVEYYERTIQQQVSVLDELSKGVQEFQTLPCYNVSLNQLSKDLLELENILKEKKKFQRDVDDFDRGDPLTYGEQNQADNRPFRFWDSTFKPPMSPVVSLFQGSVLTDLYRNLGKDYLSRDNVTRAERICIDELRSNKDIVISSADKGGAIVVQDWTQYNDEAQSQIVDQNYYKIMPVDPTAKFKVEIDAFLDLVEEDAASEYFDCLFDLFLTFLLVIISGLGSTNSVEEITEKKMKMYGPSKPPAQVLSSQYPESDPDYCVWVPPTGNNCYSSFLS
ncbi:kanadaptin [Protopterus annectens]|uniref:kanadaptin n=1 Tax=Protopterus annectens TaxID=7888 RepID=UPI001CFB9D34|nr:kanadaptin [Protopterus annectens]